jgi:DNA modification methylase
MMQDYMTAEEHGDNWSMYLDDCCERLPQFGDNSVDLSVYSPPFQSLYVYSATPRDLGNSATREEFFEHYGFVIREMLRATKPGRMSCVHAADVGTTKAVHGVTGLYHFPGDVIQAHVEAGWIYYGRVYVDKDPQAQAIRTKSQALLFVTKNKDSSKSRPAIGDELLLFRKPGDSTVPIKTDVTNEEWIQWARPCWTGIRETHTLNATVAREDADERHLHPLQLDFIERCVRLWSNPGETVLSPFAGVGSEPYTAVKLGRRGVGIELKPSYYATAVTNLKAVESEAQTPTLFDMDGASGVADARITSMATDDSADQIAELERGAHDLANEIAELEDELIALRIEIDRRRDALRIAHRFDEMADVEA